MKSFYKSIQFLISLSLAGLMGLTGGCANLNSLVDITDVDPSTIKHPVKKDLSGPEFRFFNAARKDGISVVRTLISEGVNINVIQWNQQPPENAVLLAVQSGSKRMLKLLLRKGADPNGLPAVQTTALMKAIELDRLDLVQMLLDSGADVNQAIHQTRLTALHVSIQKKDLKIAKFLIRKGANLNAQDVNGRTALMNSVEAECIECIQFLIQSGASKAVKNSNGKKAIDLATGKKK